MIDTKHPYDGKLLHGQGYLTKQLIGKEKVGALREVFQEHFSNASDAFYSSSFHPDLSVKQTANDAVLRILSEEVSGLFANFKILGSSFLQKKGGGGNPLPLHQDWTVSDESRHGTFTIWISLQDTCRSNGALRVIPGSHAIEDNPRSPSLPVAFEKDRPKFDRYLKTVELKTGEAMIFNQKLMHASWPNSSDESRLAVTIGLAPKDASLFMLYANGRNKIDVYDMPDDMFMHYPEIIDAPTIGKFKETIDNNIRSFTETDLKAGLYKVRKERSTVKPLFLKEEHQEFFETNGYIKLPALSGEDVSVLKAFLDELGFDRENGHGFYVGMDHQDKEAVSRMMDKIGEVALPKVAPYLVDFKLFTASYVIKDPSPIGVVPPHQDWTFVEDEARHCSVTCWIPLVDVGMDNGCIGVIKGSNKFFNSVRPSPSPQGPSPLNKHMFTIFPYLSLLEMKAGEALIFDNRTFHASPPNITEEPRLAVGMGFTQSDAEIRHYYLKPGTKDTLIKFRVEPEFFKHFDNGSLSRMYDAGKIPEGIEQLDEVPFVWEDLSKSEMKERITEAGNEYNKELTARMTSLFKDQMKKGVKDRIYSVVSKVKQSLESVLG